MGDPLPNAICSKKKNRRDIALMEIGHLSLGTGRRMQYRRREMRTTMQVNARTIMLYPRLFKRQRHFAIRSSFIVF